VQVVLVYLQPFLVQFTLKCVSQAEIATNWLKALFWGLMSFKVIYVDKFKSPPPVFVMMCSMYVGLPICNHFHS